MKLNKDQQKAVELMRRFVDNPFTNQSFFILSGYAGTGKTTVINHFIDTLPPTAIAMTAPTNKAVKVMARMATPSSKHEIEYLTIYKVLDLAVGFDEDNKVLLPKEGNKNKIKDFKLIILDEGSMVSSKLWELLLQIARRYRIKFIILGDPAQWLPVKEGISPIFDQESNDIPIVKLTKVMRVAGGNPLMPVIDKVRERVFDSEQWDEPIELADAFNSDRSQGYFNLSRDKWLATMVRAFNSPQWKANPDFVRAIAWTNRSVDRMNQFVRSSIYEDVTSPYLEGERLIAKDSIFQRGSDDIIIANSSEMEVLWAEPGFDKRHELKIWVMKVRTEEDKTHQLNVVDKDDVPTWTKYNRMLAELADIAKKEPIPYLRTMAWGRYWELKDKTFASVNYAYALTSHKAQGSTFNHVFVDQRDILKNPNPQERYRGLYVAYSRASDRVMAWGG